MLREYEFTVIAKADLQETARSELFEKYEAYMVKDGGEILKKDDWGVRKLAFPIKRQHRGHYRIYDFVGRSEHLQEMERLMRIDDGILRYLSLNLGENVDPEERKAELVKEAARAAKEAEREKRER